MVTASRPVLVQTLALLSFPEKFKANSRECQKWPWSKLSLRSTSLHTLPVWRHGRGCWAKWAKLFISFSRFSGDLQAGGLSVCWETIGIAFKGHILSPALGPRLPFDKHLPPIALPISTRSAFPGLCGLSAP